MNHPGSESSGEAEIPAPLSGVSSSAALWAVADWASWGSCVLRLPHSVRWHVVGPVQGTGSRAGDKQHFWGTTRGGGTQIRKEHRSPFSLSRCRWKLLPKVYLKTTVTQLKYVHKEEGPSAYLHTEQRCLRGWNKHWCRTSPLFSGDASLLGVRYRYGNTGMKIGKLWKRDLTCLGSKYCSVQFQWNLVVSISCVCCFESLKYESHKSNE